MIPRIEVDTNKCTIPYDCGICFRVCSPAVFMLHNTKMVRFQELDTKVPGNYVAIPTYLDKCTMCEECVRACPAGAITITGEEEE